MHTALKQVMIAFTSDLQGCW